MVTGCAEGLGLQALAEDLGWKVTVRIWTDSSAAKAVAKKTGAGKAATRGAEVVVGAGYGEGGTCEA